MFAHNPEVSGSNPLPATKKNQSAMGSGFFGSQRNAIAHPVDGGVGKHHFPMRGR
jgi:hypothetical protein